VLYREAIIFSKRNFLPNHPEIGTIMNNLASVLQSQNRLNEAEVLYREALNYRIKYLEANHPYIGTSIKNLDDVL
jgi:hypothetical protein